MYEMHEPLSRTHRERKEMSIYLRVITVMIALAIFAGLSIAVSADSFTIEGDKVYVDDERAYIEFTPHTIRTGWVNQTVLSKTWTGTVNLIYGFDKEGPKPKTVEICTDEHFLDCTKYTGPITKTKRNYLGLDTWYVIEDIPFTAGQPRYARLYLQVPINITGKYAFAAYPSSYGYDVKGACQAQNCYWLDPWYQNTFQNRFNVTIDSTYVEETNEYPVFLNLNETPQNFWDAVQSDGCDVRVTEDDGNTELAFDLTGFNYSANTGQLYTKQNLSASTDTLYWVYYNTSGTTSCYAEDDPYGSENVWTDYEAVYHFDVNYGDATSNDYDMFNSGMVRTVSNLGYDTQLTATNDYGTVPSAVILDSPYIYMVFKPADVASAEGSYIGRRNAFSATWFSFRLTQAVNGSLRYIMEDSGSNQANLYSSNSVSQNNWQFAGFGYNTSTTTMNLWLNGNAVEQKTILFSPTISNGYAVRLGQQESSGGNRDAENFDVSELRLANTVFSDAYMGTLETNLMHTGNFYTVAGVAEAFENDAPVLQNLTITPTNPNTTDSLIAQVNYTDLQNDNGTVYFYWFNNGSSILNTTRTAASDSFLVNDTLTPIYTSYNANITVFVNATDGLLFSSTVSGSVFIASAPDDDGETPVSSISLGGLVEILIVFGVLAMMLVFIFVSKGKMAGGVAFVLGMFLLIALWNGQTFTLVNEYNTILVSVTTLLMLLGLAALIGDDS